MLEGQRTYTEKITEEDTDMSSLSVIHQRTFITSERVQRALATLKIRPCRSNSNYCGNLKKIKKKREKAHPTSTFHFFSKTVSSTEKHSFFIMTFKKTLFFFLVTVFRNPRLKPVTTFKLEKEKKMKKKDYETVKLAVILNFFLLILFTLF